MSSRLYHDFDSLARDESANRLAGRSITAVLDVIRPLGLEPLGNMTNRGTRGAYRKEDRVSLPPELQKELVEKAAARYGNCQELAKHLNIPKSSVHYYRIGRLTMPFSILEQMLKVAGDADLEKRVKNTGIEKDRTWANEYAVSVYREMCRDKLRLPTREDLEKNDDLRRKAAAIVSYVMAEGSVWLQKEKWGECAVNITFAAHETDLYEHFRSLCKDVFLYDIGPPQQPGNGAVAIRGFIYSRFVAEWLIENGVLPGYKSARELHLPSWVMRSQDELTWTSSLQPWCDGEGGVSGRRFSVSQSRHTDIDIATISLSLAQKSGRSIARGYLSRVQLYGMPAIQYCETLFRSEILDDVNVLSRRLTLKPRAYMTSLRYKDDGYWSCIWTTYFDSEDSQKMLEIGLIRQEAKRAALRREQ